MLFNTTTTMSFKDIQTATEISIPDLKRNLLTLSSARYRILMRKAEKTTAGAAGAGMLHTL